MVSPNAFEGAKLWSATEVAELSTAEESGFVSGFVGFLTAAYRVDSISTAKAV